MDGMDDDYCYRCGAYTAIDRLTKVCRRCYDLWCGELGLPSASTGSNPVTWSAPGQPLH
jgi:hypothetical protein